jgi:hypothetical protein
MLSILFPHLVEDVEYLLPPPEADGVSGANAVAGPSRLRGAL